MVKSDIAISVREICKEYVIAHEKHTTLGEKFMSRLGNPLRRATTEKFRALQDVTFDVKKGEIIGIIGRNGAGKSTLLKILSRITEPTSGEVRLYGRVASLLEVGTGFHPELTGRENIYLNGAILGMKRSEVRDRFDEIVDFAEIEKFLDTPVKRYSSGMYVRLAFAVAAHMEPEILIVDEVLAVGDGEFQKKCLGKMGKVSKGDGRTVLFVSHNMAAVAQLCNRVVHLCSGTVAADTTNVEVGIQHYFGDVGDKQAQWTATKPQEFDFQATRLCVAAQGHSNPEAELFRQKRYDVIIEGVLKREMSDLCIGYALYANDGTLLYWTYHCDLGDGVPLALGENTLRSAFPVEILNHGEYRLELIGGRHGKQWFYEPQVSSPWIKISVAGSLGASPMWQHRRPGVLAPVPEWSRRGSR